MATLTRQRFDIEVREGWCKTCGLCTAFCPQTALTLERVPVLTSPEACDGCKTCEQVCPDLAIDVIRLRRER